MEKEELREHIIKRASEMFVQNSIKGVTMDSISKELSISKRTLYEIFSSKNELLTSIIDTLNTKYLTNSDSVLKSDITSLEKIFQLASINKERNHYDEVLCVDLIENHPLILTATIDRTKDENAKRLLYCVNEGIDEGYINGDINLDIPLNLLLASRLTRHSPKLSDKIKLTTIEIHIYGVVFFLMSIATAKGLAEIERLCKINNINIYKK